MSEKTTWFITGTSRGIGLEFVRQLSADPENVVIASCRDPESANELNSLKSDAKGELHVVKLDVVDEASIKSAAEQVAVVLDGKGLDYLLNNAGVNPGDDGAFNFSVADFQSAIQSNVIGPALIGQNFLPFLEKGKRRVIMNMTSGLASVGMDHGRKCCSYSISKAALNMLTYKQSKEREDIIALVVDPGWVKTKMGGVGAYLELHESVTPFIAFLKSTTKEHSGGFFSYKGERKPW